ncbi:hypothetical protein ABZV91_32280, partial [Nocardia sp. NPDC004568]|uniref:hypothetical protein n=1 Tax=Nocardia sp. NPDC004568 TaxID=3154551 RepID=UPI0033BF7D9A
MTEALEWLGELGPLQTLIFGAEIPEMDTDAGRRVRGVWEQAGVELGRLAGRLVAEIALLPEAVQAEMLDVIVGAAQPLVEAVAGVGGFCKKLGEHCDLSAANSDKETYTMVAFGVMTVYQVMAAGGGNPVAGAQVVAQARARHLARWAEFVAERAGAGAAAFAERAGLLATQVGGFAVFAGGVDAGIQGVQVLVGRREVMDWDSVAVATVAGGASAAGGVLGVELVR